MGGAERGKDVVAGMVREVESGESREEGSGRLPVKISIADFTKWLSRLVMVME
jgi:hypothetical protein